MILPAMEASLVRPKFARLRSDYRVSSLLPHIAAFNGRGLTAKIKIPYKMWFHSGTITPLREQLTRLFFPWGFKLPKMTLYGVSLLVQSSLLVSAHSGLQRDGSWIILLVIPGFNLHEQSQTRWKPLSMIWLPRYDPRFPSYCARRDCKHHDVVNFHL